MNKFDIEPTKMNLINSILKDVTGRNSNIESLIRLLSYQSDSWSIAINGVWGCGKTFFVKQCQLMLDNLGTEPNNGQVQNVGVN